MSDSGPVTAVKIERVRLPRPSCRGINPDIDNQGPYCTSCGYSLVERGKWYVHGNQWQHPEVWTRGTR